MTYIMKVLWVVAGHSLKSLWSPGRLKHIGRVVLFRLVVRFCLTAVPHALIVLQGVPSASSLHIRCRSDRGVAMNSNKQVTDEALRLCPGSYIAEPVVVQTIGVIAFHEVG